MNNDTLALDEWFEKKKTDWVQKTCTVDELGMHRVDILKKRIDALQAKVDSLVLEFCPEDMTEDQLNNWKLNQTSSSGGWIKWDGGDCPFENTTLVDVILLEGNFIAQYLSSMLRWEHTGTADIIAYRISVRKSKLEELKIKKTY